MIRHLFLLIWNKRNQHIFLILELFLFFLATSFLGFGLFSSPASNTNKVNIDNLVEINWGYTPNTRDLIKQNFLNIKAVKSISHTSFLPYRISSVKMAVRNGSIIENVDEIRTDYDLQKTIDLKLLRGRWFQKDDIPDNFIVIGKGMEKAFFGAKSPIGQKLKIGETHRTILGVCEDIWDVSKFSDSQNFYFLLDTTNTSYTIAKLRTPLNEKIYKEMNQAIKNSVMQTHDSYGIIPISQYKQDKERNTKSFVSVLSIVAGFLIINIILGLYSTLYQTINKRRGEIGIRRAAGARSGNIYKQIILEVLLLTTLSITVGIIVGYQFMLFNVLEGEPINYIMGMVFATVSIYILVTLCALYPAYLAARIHPAEALHDD